MTSTAPDGSGFHTDLEPVEFSVPLHAAPRAPVEAKVIASAGGSTAGLVLSAAAVGFIDDLVYRSGPVPDYVTGLVFLVVTTGLTWFAGYRTHHTPRPDLPPREG